MSVSSVNSSNSYAAQDSSDQEGQTDKPKNPPQSENTSSSSSGNGSDAQTSANSNAQESDSSGATNSPESENAATPSGDGNGNAQAPADSEAQQSDSSGTTGSSESADATPSSSDGNGDTQTSGDYGNRQDDAAGTVGSSASDDTPRSSNGGSSDAQTSADHRSQRVDASETPGNPKSGNAQQPSSGSNGTNGTSGTNGSGADAQTPGDYGSGQGNRSGTAGSSVPGSEQPSSAGSSGDPHTSRDGRSRSGNESGTTGRSLPVNTPPPIGPAGQRQASQDGDTQGDKSWGKQEALPRSDTQGSPHENDEYNQVRGSGGTQHSDDSKSSNSSPEGDGASFPATSGEYGKSSENHGDVQGNSYGQGAISSQSGQSSPSQGFIDSADPKSSAGSGARTERDSGSEEPGNYGVQQPNASAGTDRLSSENALPFASGTVGHGQLPDRNGMQQAGHAGQWTGSQTDSPSSGGVDGTGHAIYSAGARVPRDDNGASGSWAPQVNDHQQGGLVGKAESSLAGSPSRSNYTADVDREISNQDGFKHEQDWVHGNRFQNQAGSAERDADPDSTGQAASRQKRGDTGFSLAQFAGYADHVLRVGQRSPLSESQLDDERRGVVNSVQSSHSRLADPHTADMIGNTILGALNGSPTFRAAVSYSRNNGGEQLGNLMYTNAYTYNANYQGDPSRDMENMSADYLQGFQADNMPIEINNAARSRSNGVPPTINIGAAPNSDSPYMGAWQEGLMHELMHQLTNSDDPPESMQQYQLGPTEILARRVAQEMGWQMPDFAGYGAPEREAYLEQRQRVELVDAAQRNAAHEGAFFQRLATIRDRYDADGNRILDNSRDASPDFHELEAAPPSGVANDHTYAHPPTPPHQANHTYALYPQGDLSQMQFHNGTVSLFPFAHSAPAGAPSGYDSAYGASGASWDTQGRFFQYGKPVDGNPHVREFDFQDGSKIVASAHEPQLASSDLSKFEQGATVFGGALGGGTLGLLTGGPAGAAAGGVGGAALGERIASTYPYDRIWQGYTLDYYNKGETKPFYTQHMYAWDSNWSRVGLLTRQNDASLWPDYADGDPDGSWEWWKWKSGNAPLRT